MLEFSISNQTLSRLDAAQAVSDSENYLRCAFQFSQDWDGVTAVAVFSHRDRERTFTVPIVDGTCQVPSEVIHPYGFALAVYGSGSVAQGVYAHIPTDAVFVEVAAAGVAEGLAAPAPTADLYDALLDRLRDSEQAAVAAKAAALASAEAAEGSALAAEAAKSAAETARQQTSQQAMEALEAAQSAQRSMAAADELVELAQAARSELDGRIDELDRVLVLHRSYAMGTGSYARLGVIDGITWTGGSYSTGLLGLEEGRRYLVDVDGVRYDAVSVLAGTGTGSGGGDVDEELPQDPFGDIVTLGENIRPETPPGGDPGVPVEPAPVYREVELRAGPVTLVDRRNVSTAMGMVQGSCVITTTDPAVTSIALYTDGHDNGRYYMEQARLARDEARDILDTIRGLV